MPKEATIAQDMPNCTLGLRGKMRNATYCVGCDCDTCGWNRAEAKRRSKLFSDINAFPPPSQKGIRHLKLS